MGIKEMIYELRTKTIKHPNVDEEEYDVIPEDAKILDQPPTPDQGDADAA